MGAWKQPIVVVEKYQFLKNLLLKRASEETRPDPAITDPVMAGSVLSTLLERFYANARSCPEAIALTYQEKSITYADLLNKVEVLAKKITSAITTENTKEAPICLLGDDKLRLVILQLAVLRAGCFFAVLDHQSPPSAIEKQVAELGAKLTITCNFFEADEFRGQKWRNIKSLSIEQLSSASNDGPLPSEIHDNSLAYILLTSGSTGTPKAVKQTHQGLFQQMQRYYRIIGVENNEAEHFSNFAPLCHDQGIVDIYAALLSSKATLSLFDMQTLFTSDDGMQFARDFLIKQKISIFSALPDIFKFIFAEQDENNFPDLRVIAIGADEVKQEHLNIFLASCPDNSALYNSYGASECSWICGYKITKTEAKNLLSTPNIGIPIGHFDATLSLFIRPLDDNDDHQRQPHLGELCVSGEGVSPGYYNNQEATDLAFYQDGEKWFYRTGDIAELSGLTLFHKGRLANLEKISGKRVDINELEKSLCRVLQVETCVVVAITLEQQKMLCAFTAIKELPNGLKLIWHLGAADKTIKDNFATHLQPSHFFELIELPKLASGKVDRQALKKIALDHFATFYEFQGSDVERLVFSEAKKILGAVNWDEKITSENMPSITRAMFLTAINRALNRTYIQFSDLANNVSLREIANILQMRLNNPVDQQEIGFKCAAYSGNKFLFSYEMIKSIMLYFMERSPELQLQPCESHNDFLEKIRRQIQMKIPRVGYTVPAIEFGIRVSKNNHPSACLVDYDEKTKELIVWVSDSYAHFYIDNVVTTLECWPGKLKIGVDISVRREKGDSSNCVFDALSFLTNAFTEPSLFNWALPLQQTEKTSNQFNDFHRKKHEIFNFASPKEMIHKIPAFLGGYAPNQTLDTLGDFYTALIVALKEHDISGKAISSVEELMPLIDFNTSSNDKQMIKTALDFGNQMKILDQTRRDELYTQSKEQFQIIVENAADLGRILQYLKPNQCVEVCNMFKDTLPAIIKNYTDLGYLLRYLDESQQLATSHFFKECIINSKRIDLEKYASNFAEMSTRLSDSQYREACIIFKNQLSLLSYDDNTIRYDPIRTQFELIVRINRFLQNKSRFHILLEICGDQLEVKDLREFKAFIGYALAEEATNRLAIYNTIRNNTSEIINNNDAFLRMLNSFCQSEIDIKLLPEIINFVLTPEKLEALQWNNEDDIPAELGPYEEIKNIIVFKQNEKKAIEAFFKFCPGWQNKTALSVNEITEIVDLACSTSFSQGFFSNDLSDLPMQARNALISCGADSAIFTAKMDNDEKSKKIVESITQYSKDSARRIER